MNTLLIFFALPIAVIIVSAILQKVLKCPLAVAALIFAIFLVVTFAAFDATFLIATLAYTILAFITALIVQLLCNENNNEDDDDGIQVCIVNDAAVVSMKVCSVVTVTFELQNRMEGKIGII